MTLGGRIALVRGKTSRKLFAEALGIHPQTLCMYEKNKRNVSIDIINKICDTYNILVEWLTKGSDSIKTDAGHLSSALRDDSAMKDGLPAPAAAPPAPHCTAKGTNLPVLGLAACGMSGWYNPGPMGFRLSLPVDYPYSPALFAVIAVGTSTQPEGIKPGFVLFCDPVVPPTANDAVYVEKKDGTASVKTYKKQDDKWLYLQGWLPPDEEGVQKPYFEQLFLETVSKMACVILVKRKA